MKKTYFYIAGGTIVFILVGFWVYSFLHGSPTNDGSIFTNLGIFGQNNTEEIFTPPTAEEAPTVDIATEKLRQLTTKPVIAARIVDKASTTIMRYVEAGTGHIFDIDLVSGQETRVSQISVPVAEKAAISPNGTYAAIRSGLGNEGLVTLINLSDIANPSSTKLPNQMRTFAFGYNNELLFTDIALGQTEGKGYLPSTGTTRRLFTAPFVAHEMAWSESSTTNHIIYTKPAASMIGYAYEVTAAGLKRLPMSGKGLTLVHSFDLIIFGQTGDDNMYRSQIYNKSNNLYKTTPVKIIPEKCVVVTKDSLYCAGTTHSISGEFPDDWYKGKESFDDYIWTITPGKEATKVAHPMLVVGRSLDISNMAINSRNTMLYFVNKIDNTLWLYEI